MSMDEMYFSDSQKGVLVLVDKLYTLYTEQIIKILPLEKTLFYTSYLWLYSVLVFWNQLNDLSPELVKFYRSAAGDPEDRVTNVRKVRRHYDFVVIGDLSNISEVLRWCWSTGGGSAGAVMANRLSEVSGHFQTKLRKQIYQISKICLWQFVMWLILVVQAGEFCFLRRGPMSRRRPIFLYLQTPCRAASLTGSIRWWEIKPNLCRLFFEILNSRVTNQYQLVQFSDRASTRPRMSWAGGRPDELAKGKGLSCKVISHVGNQSEGKMIKSIFQHYEQCILFAKDQNSS